MNAEQLMLRVHNDEIAQCRLTHAKTQRKSSWQFAPWRKSTGTRCNALWRGKARKWELT
jgi:hypothetical protein